MLKTRALTAVIGIPVLLFLLYLGGIFWDLVFLFMAVVALYEYLTMMNHKGISLWIPAYYLMMVLLLQNRLPLDSGLLVFIGLLLFAVEFIVRFPQVDLADIARSFFGAFYIGYLLHFAFDIASLELSFFIMLMVLLLTWANDVGAFFAGTLWGRHYLPTGISPNKTWEGCVGGILLTILTACLFNVVLAMPVSSLLYLSLLGLLASLAAQLGDLVVSGMKRYAGVDDSGFILPGHGGILDRFDSFLLVLPVVYYLIQLFLSLS